MDFTNDFFIQSQGCIERVFRANRPKLLNLHGNVKVDIKSNQTVVTSLDKAMEKELRAELKKFDSAIGIEGEEFGVEGNRDLYWLIDPIDGTEEFIRGLPFVRNMVTLIENDKPVFAVVFCPISDELYVAAKGEGTYRNGLPVHVSERPMDRAWVEFAVGFQTQIESTLANNLSSQVNSLRRLNSFTSVADGKLDAHICYKGGGGTWDYSPRALLIEEAGGRVANFGSDHYDMHDTSFLMSNPVIFDDLMQVINQTIDKN